jgi:hypothetical protein
MLYVYPVPVGDVTVMVPVETVQVGSIVVATIAAGTSNAAFTVAAVATPTQPVVVFLTVTAYVPDITPLKVALDW